ncbi:MAG TPA: regulatory signaling modulator protein AmpE [Thiobacillaceae bacterium]|nr:regulatory signaling modulator protein AmpE [Thiobacillaceae bacterium]
MTLLSIIAALLWEQYRPLRGPLLFDTQFSRWSDWLVLRAGAGPSRHWLLAWGLGALLPAAAVALAGALLEGLHVVFAWAWSVAVLYLATGFKGITFTCASIARALKEGNLPRARELLAEWGVNETDEADESALSRITIEELLRLAVTRLLGMIFWFALLGVFGAVLYRLTHLCYRRWRGEPAFAEYMGSALRLMDWLPVRVAAFGFAIVGNFEDAMYGWRTQAMEWEDLNEGVLLASAAGALGVRLGGPLQVAGETLERPELGEGEPATPEYMDGAVALIWRVALLWVAVLGLLWLGGL